jgi:chaperonin GroES
MKIKPLGDRVLLKRKLVSEENQKGIYIPDSAQKKPQEAEVIAIGPGKKNEKGKLVPLLVSIGDTVLLAAYGGTEVTYGDETFLLLSEDDLLGIIN